MYIFTIKKYTQYFTYICSKIFYYSKLNRGKKKWEKKKIIWELKIILKI